SCLISGVFLTNIVLNVYLIVMLFYRNAWDTVFRTVMTLLVVTQILGPLATLLPMIFFAKRINSTAKVVLQHMLRMTMFKPKWKSLTYYEQLYRKNRFVFTVGALGKATSRTLYQVK